MKPPKNHQMKWKQGTFQKKEFRIMMVKMIQDLGKAMKKMQEMLTKDLQELKNK